MTGSEAWQKSGADDKEAGVGEMKAASERRDPSQGYGKVEQMAGKVTGCEVRRAESQVRGYDD